MSVGLAIACVAVPLLMMAPRLVQAQTVRTVLVESKRRWQPVGITLAHGQEISFKVHSGTWTHHPDVPPYGPEGAPPPSAEEEEKAAAEEEDAPKADAPPDPDHPNDPEAQPDAAVADEADIDTPGHADSAHAKDPTEIEWQPGGDGYIAPLLPPGALVGRIGAHGEPFLIGRGVTGVAEGPGELFVSINDREPAPAPSVIEGEEAPPPPPDPFADNRGQINVEVRTKAPPAQPPPTTCVTRNLEAKSPGLDTAISVDAHQSVTVRALGGQWRVRADKSVSAAGVVNADGPRSPLLPGAPEGALVARIADGPWFLVGQEKTLRADRAGLITIAANDDTHPEARADNAGQIPVQICLSRYKTKRTLIVKANAGWINTGISLAHGDTLTLRAQSAWSVGAIGGGRNGGMHGPEGRRDMPASEKFPLPGQPVGMLIARLGNQGTTFPVGEGGYDTLRPGDPTGVLFLGINDVDGFEGGLADNTGQIVVEVLVE